jgi:hypothetical protein
LSNRRKNFLDYWLQITRLTDEIFKQGRLDRQQIEAVLAPPLVMPRAMPHRGSSVSTLTRVSRDYTI